MGKICISLSEYNAHLEKMNRLEDDNRRLKKIVDLLLDNQSLQSLSLHDIVAAGSRSEEPSGDCVDLGLPSGRLWCTHNVGAKNPEDSGLFFSWGNTEGHTEDSGYDFSEEEYKKTPGAKLDGNIAAGSEYDAASVNMGGTWHMPTFEDNKELCDNTDWEEAVINGVSGLKFMKKSDHSVYIFMPFTGFFAGTSRDDRGSDGSYWSSTWGSARDARYLYFYSGGVNPLYNVNRCLGFPVRAVQ